MTGERAPQGLAASSLESKNGLVSQQRLIASSITLLLATPPFLAKSMMFIPILVLPVAAFLNVATAMPASIASSGSPITDSFTLSDDGVEGYLNDTNTDVEVTIACTGPDDNIVVYVCDENGQAVEGSFHFLYDGTSTAPVSTPPITVPPGHVIKVRDLADANTDGAGIQALIEW